MVPWMSDKDTCKKPIPRLPSHTTVINWLKLIYKYSWTGFYFDSESCLLPCTLLSTHAKYLQMTRKTYDDHRISLFFENTVSVQTILPAYSWGNLLVEIGSSLGLWLGISVVGIFDIGVVAVFKIAQCMSSRTKREKAVVE